MKAKASARAHLFLIFVFLLSVIFLPTAFLLFVGLLPMFVAFFVDRTRKKLKAVTVGAMNIAGCLPFLMELWMSEHTLDRSISIILNPMAIIVIYVSAGVGYLIDWALTRFIAGVLYHRGISRKRAIEVRQAELVERWGMEVSGKLPLDSEGFPIENM